MNKVLITGDEGFVSSHLSEHLKEKGFEIIGFDIKTSILQDVRDAKLINDFMEVNKPDIVIHLAANPDVGTSIKEPELDASLNILGTINVLEASRKNNVKLFMFSSTAVVYGEPQKKEMDELHQLKPASPYGISKLASENYIRFYHEKYGLPTVTFRFFNIYGDNQVDWVVVPRLIKRMAEEKSNEFKMYGSKDDSRDFVYIKDICRAFEFAIEKRPVGQVINLGSGNEVFILDLAKKIASILGKEFEYKYDESRSTGKITRMAADISKAKELIGWEPKFSLESGLKRVVESFSFSPVSQEGVSSTSPEQLGKGQR